MSDAAPAATPIQRLERKNLAAFLKTVRSSAAAADDLPRRAPGQLVQATEEQQQIWLHAELAQKQLYNEPITIHFDGELDELQFERAFNAILERHEAWRTTFEWRDGKLMQIVADQLSVKIPIVDLRSLPTQKREQAAFKGAMEGAKQKIALDRLPLFRCVLFRLADDRYRFCLTLHHIIFDGVSLYGIFLPELQAFYAAFQGGTHSNLPGLTRQYGDYALHMQERSGLRRAESMNYWAGVFRSPAPPLALPFDFPRPASRTFDGEMVKFSLSKDLSTGLRELGERESATLFMVLVAAYHILLYSYTAATDQSVGTATSTRKHESTQHMLGLFLNTVVLRSSFTPEQSFLQLLKTVRQTVVGALLNDDISFRDIVAQFQPDRVDGLNPLFQVMFSLEPPLVPLGAQWRFTQMDVETRLSKYDLHLEMDDRVEGMIGRFFYSVELFKKGTIEQMRTRWVRLLELIPQHPEWTIERLVLASQKASPVIQSVPSSNWRRARDFLKGLTGSRSFCN